MIVFTEKELVFVDRFFQKHQKELLEQKNYQLCHTTDFSYSHIIKQKSKSSSHNSNFETFCRSVAYTDGFEASFWDIVTQEICAPCLNYFFSGLRPNKISRQVLLLQHWAALHSSKVTSLPLEDINGIIDKYHLVVGFIVELSSTGDSLFTIKEAKEALLLSLLQRKSADSKSINAQALHAAFSTWQTKILHPVALRKNSLLADKETHMHTLLSDVLHAWTEDVNKAFKPLADSSFSDAPLAEIIDSFIKDNPKFVFSKEFFPLKPVSSMDRHASFKSWVEFEYLISLQEAFKKEVSLWDQMYVSFIKNFNEVKEVVVVKNFKDLNHRTVFLATLFPEDAFVSTDGSLVFLIPKLSVKNHNNTANLYVKLGDVSVFDTKEIIDMAVSFCASMPIEQALPAARLTMKTAN